MNFKLKSQPCLKSS